jgi:hypothetical protein
MRLLFVLILLILLSIMAVERSGGQTIPPFTNFLPIAPFNQEPAGTIPPATPEPVEGTPEWDPRLTQRGAAYHAVPEPVEGGYYRLIRARWYNEVESQGRHHIFVEVLDENGKRKVGVPILVTWATGSATVVTEAKPGEPWAANVAMFALAPAYSAQPQGTADSVNGMGLGSLVAPNFAIHTSYGLTWQWVKD